jgi:hypothetical protein
MPEILTLNRSDDNLLAAHQEGLAEIITETESYFSTLKD